MKKTSGWVCLVTYELHELGCLNIFWQLGSFHPLKKTSFLSPFPSFLLLELKTISRLFLLLVSHRSCRLSSLFLFFSCLIFFLPDWIISVVLHSNSQILLFDLFSYQFSLLHFLFHSSYSSASEFLFSSFLFLISLCWTRFVHIIFLTSLNCLSVFTYSSFCFLKTGILILYV